MRGQAARRRFSSKMPADLVAISPTSPANLGAAIRFDDGFWRDNLAKLGQRFDAWLAQH